MADIRDKTKTLAEIRDNWQSTGIESALYGRCAFMDIDAITERRGRFLIIERNRKGGPLSTGQELTFRALARLEQFNVVEVWGEPNTYPRIRIFYPDATNDKIHDLEALTQDEQIAFMRELVTQWTTKVNT